MGSVNLVGIYFAPYNKANHIIKEQSYAQTKSSHR